MGKDNFFEDFFHSRSRFKDDLEDFYHWSQPYEVGKEKKPPGPSGQVTSARNKPGWVYKMVLLRGWWWWHGIYSDLTVPNKAEEVDYNERKDDEEDGAGHEEV